jgi:sulfite dehydrogenase (quinone) subunit SoeB
VAERGGFDLMPELGYAPTNKYLPPRPRQVAPGCTGAAAALEPAEPQGGFLAWLDCLLTD